MACCGGKCHIMHPSLTLPRAWSECIDMALRMQQYFALSFNVSFVPCDSVSACSRSCPKSGRCGLHKLMQAHVQLAWQHHPSRTGDMPLFRLFMVPSMCPQLAVEGMTCSACTTAVEKALKTVPGVKKVSVALLAKTAEVGVRSGKGMQQQLCCA